MLDDVLAPPARDSLTPMKGALEKMQARLDLLLGAETLTADALIEITGIFNNVSYIFLYLEANDTLVEYSSLLPYRKAFFLNRALDDRLLNAMRRARYDDEEVDLARLDFIEQIEGKYRNSAAWADEKIEKHKAAAKAEQLGLAADQKALLEKLCKREITQNPAAVLYRLTSTTADPARRGKLSRAFGKLADERGARMVPHVDAMIETRHEKAAELGHTSPLAKTLQNCRVSEDVIAAFLDETLKKAVLFHERVEREIVETLGPLDTPLDSFGFYMRQRFGQSTPPTFDLSACINFIFKVGAAVFGAEYSISPESTDHVLKVDVSIDGAPVGRINFDLWETHGKDLGANHTLLIRNRGSWGVVQQLPEAYVACRFGMQTEEGPSWINFQNVHSLYHEFGHAMNHLLIRERIPSKSGLDYLPIERLELLSMWAEKWVYHPAFGDALDLADAHGLRQCQLVKMVEYRRTFVERAAIAALDFHVHRRANLNLAAAFEAMDHDYGIGRFVSLSGLAGYFTWPMYIANPGANFTYLWGAAHSCEVFEHFMPLSLDQVAAQPHLVERLNSCFDFTCPSHIPDIDSLYRFYGTTEEATRTSKEVSAP